MKLIFEGNDSLTLEMPLATATRLTDELIGAEFLERCPGIGLLPPAHERNDPASADIRDADIGDPLADLGLPPLAA